MAWRLEGTYFENCNCDVVCPCSATSLALPGDYDRCEVVLAFHIDRGDVEGVDVSDLSVVVVADTPKQMTDGNWSVGVFMDEKASAEQAGALGAVFGGAKGGPMGMLAPLIGDMRGMETAAIEYRDDGFRHHLKVGDQNEIDVEDIVAQGETEPSKLTGLHHPANTTLTVARASKARVNAFGFEFSNDGKNGHSAPFSWAA